MEIPTKGASDEPKKQAKIMVVEDDMFLRNLLVKKLNSEGYAVLAAIDGPAALRILESDIPHLILLDLLLPGMDGFEVMNRIKKDERITKIPILVLSNLGSEDDVSRAQRLGATDYIIKANFTLEEIVERIKKLLNEKYFSVA